MRPFLDTAVPYLSRYRRGIALGLGALVLKDVAGAGIPLMIKLAIDSVSAGRPLNVLYLFCGALLAMAGVKAFFQYWMRVILVGISRDVEFDIRNDLFRQFTRLDSGFYGGHRTGDLMARSTNDLNAVRMMLGPALMYFIETALTFLLALAIMFSVDWRLTLWALTPAPVVTFVVIYFGQRIHRRFEKIQGLFSDISSRVQENLSGVRVVRAYAQEEAELEQFAALNERFIHQNVRLARLSGLFMPLLQALIGLTFMLVLLVGGFRLLDGDLSLGSFVMFNTYMGILVWPMIAFGWVVNLMQRGSASLKRIRAVLDEKPGIVAPEAPEAVPEEVTIGLHGARMGWNGFNALTGVDMRIRQGETVAIVGRTGSGKSTLVQLIARLLDPVEGEVRIGGVDVRRMDPEELRRLIGFVPQETFLFSATLGENIAFGVDNASEEQIRAAAEMAGLDKDIEDFPLGYQTMVGERGITLSGGQKQRTAIARAILRDPRILILDDALSAVDTITEERILGRLRAFMKGRTTILISHRVSTVRQADRINVLDQGRIVEQGRHEELITRGGYYADLHQKQLLEEELESI
ncbi:MAG: ABC transporter ATP-binding protein/permease [Bryobacteraceae bacterium]|nr:ABC transporter ATP-binding protein/permease [Bryobacteraceae bacterium]